MEPLQPPTDLPLGPEKRLSTRLSGVYETGEVQISGWTGFWKGQIRTDYLLTNEYRADEVRATLKKIRILVADKRGVAPEDIDMTNVEAFYILEGSYIDGSLEQAVADYGSMDGYIREDLGISEDEIEKLKSQLLNDQIQVLN